MGRNHQSPYEIWLLALHKYIREERMEQKQNRNPHKNQHLRTLHKSMHCKSLEMVLLEYEPNSTNIPPKHGEQFPNNINMEKTTLWLSQRELCSLNIWVVTSINQGESVT